MTDGVHLIGRDTDVLKRRIQSAKLIMEESADVTVLMRCLTVSCQLQVIFSRALDVELQDNWDVQDLAGVLHTMKDIAAHNAGMVQKMDELPKDLLNIVYPIVVNMWRQSSGSEEGDEAVCGASDVDSAGLGDVAVASGGDSEQQAGQREGGD